MSYQQSPEALEAPTDASPIFNVDQLFEALEKDRQFFKQVKVTQYRQPDPARSLKNAHVLMSVVKRPPPKVKIPKTKIPADTPPAAESESAETPIHSPSPRPAAKCPNPRRPHLIIPPGMDIVEFRRLQARESVRKYREKVKTDEERLKRYQEQKKRSQKKYMETLRSDPDRYGFLLFKKREKRKQQQDDAPCGEEGSKAM